MKDRHLISVDELRAAGALDVPAAWACKSLGVEPNQWNLPLFADDDTLPEEQQPTPSDPDGDGEPAQ